MWAPSLVGNVTWLPPHGRSSLDLAVRPLLQSNSTGCTLNMLWRSLGSWLASDTRVCVCVVYRAARSHTSTAHAQVIPHRANTAQVRLPVLRKPARSSRCTCFCAGHVIVPAAASPFSSLFRGISTAAAVAAFGSLGTSGQAQAAGEQQSHSFTSASDASGSARPTHFGKPLDANPMLQVSRFRMRKAL